MGADSFEFAVQENAVFVSGRKNFKTAAKSVGRQTLRKQMCSGSMKKVKAESFQQNPQNTSVYRKKQFYKHFSTIMSSNFRYHTFVEVSGNLRGKVPVVEDVLLSHEKEISPTTSRN